MSQPPPASPSKSKLVVPENTLRKKVGFGGFDQQALIRAQSVIENNTIDFRPIATGLVADLDKILSLVDGTPPIPEDEFIPEIMYPVMQLKAQGSLFHYPSVTRVTQTVIDFLEVVTRADAKVIAIVTAYRNTINALIKLEIKDDASKTCEDLCNAFIGVCARYHKANSTS